ncbi:type II toxin-antitoxin system HicA family toxin [bacterium]|nr:type II toxin-antitoxin system HicA family toxin [bacterium]
MLPPKQAQTQKLLSVCYQIALEKMPLYMVPNDMGSAESLIEKLDRQNIKQSELETLLSRLGFIKIRGKGSHEVWGHHQYPDIHIVIASHSKDVPSYQLRQIKKSLQTRGIL